MSARSRDTWAARWRRRAVTLPTVLVACMVLVLIWPLLALSSFGVGLLRRRRFALLRTVTLAGAYALMELWGLSMLGLAWLSSGCGVRRDALERRAFSVQRLWLRGLWWAARACFGLRVAVEGGELPRGPWLVFARHTSMLDVLIPGNHVLGSRLQLRWVLKKELLLEPCLDIAGHWMPNHFVDRSGEHSGAELAAIEALAQGMSPEQGAIIFPEGTRFSSTRRARVLERLRASDPAAAHYAAGLQHLLPPRSGGAGALLAGAPEARVLFLAHYGLEGSRSWTELLSGELVGRTLRVRLNGAPRPEATGASVEAWLREHWVRMDAWIGQQARLEAEALE